ncbi:Nucleoporin [Vanrija pseudolonga]|uniref:Nucleoporin n=1 Tax=Vanrija pseudolonga TaxID=143232 RepID=A0AAF1BFC4_9TREE|nr:Nucleoporin [Vanrija pseudolonga]
MASSNAFGALAMGDASAGPSTRLLEGDEVDIDWLKLVKTNHEVYVRVSDPVGLDGLPAHSSMLAVANSADLLIVGGNNDLRVHRLSALHKLVEDAVKDATNVNSTPVATVPLPARPVWIKLATGDQRLVVVTANDAVLLFQLQDLAAGNTAPYATLTSGIPSNLLDVLPNPAAPSEQQANLVTLLAPQGLVFVDVAKAQVSKPLAGPFTAGSWSVKGKQIVLGTPDGKLVQYSPEGEVKNQVPAPPELNGEQPAFLQWLENDLFLAGYAAEGSDEVDLYTIHRNKQEITYTKFFDMSDTMGYPSRASAFRLYAGLQQWGQTKHVAFLLSAAAAEIGQMVGKPPADKTSTPEWEIVVLEGTARGSLPAAGEGTSALGLELDLTSTKAIKRGMVGGEEQPDLPPAPRLLVYSHSGQIISFDVRYDDAGAYPYMVTGAAATPAPAATPATIAPVATVEAAKPAFGGFGKSAFGGAPAGGSAFGAKSAFGQSSAPTSAFGQPAAAPKPAFGQSSGFGQSTTPSSTPAKPAFGTSAFGGSTTPAAAPKAPAFGSSGFGQSTTPSTTPAAKPAFGSSAFGQSSTPSAFGASAFGQSSSPSAFGQSSTPSAFGQSSTPQSAFGSKASTGSAFGTSAFGASSGGSAFGAAASKDSAFGAKPSAPAFNFGGSTTVPKKDEAKPAFGSSAFGAGSAFGGGSAFGSSSGFGKSSFGGTGGSAFDKPAPAADKPAEAPKDTKAPPTNLFGQGNNTNPFAKKDDNKPAAAGGDAFGLGDLGAGLSSSKTVPGLESPPPSPPAGKARVPGLEDDDDEAPARMAKPAPPPAAPSSASSFIKPATAFGSATSGGFGAFGGSASKTSAFTGSTTTPSAFSSSPTSTPAAAGSTFGKPSAIGSGSSGQDAKPGFVKTTALGSSAFGQSSGFGQTKSATTSTPAAGSGFGSISGGFGGFAAKVSTGSDDKKPAGGFAGFAAAGETKSVFGDGPAKPFSFGSTAKKDSVFAPAPSKSPEHAPVEAPKPEKAVMPEGYALPTPAPTEPAPATSTPTVTPTPVSLPDEIVDPEDDVDENEDDDDYDEEEYDDEEYDDEYDEEEDAAGFEDEEDENAEEDEDEEEEHEEGHSIRSRPSFVHAPEMDTIPEGDETASEGEDDDDQETSPSKPPKSPTWFASQPGSSPPSLLSRMGPPATQTPPNQQASGSGTPSLLSRLSPQPGSPSATFANKHAPKTSSPLSALPVRSAEDETSTPSGSPAASVPPSPEDNDKESSALSQSPKSQFGVGLGLASAAAAPLFGNNNNKKEEKKPVFSFGGDADKEEKDSSTPPFTTQPVVSPPDEWTCDTCMLKNPDSAKEKCTVCEAPRPGAAPPAPPAATGPPKPPSVPTTGGFAGFGVKAPAASSSSSPTPAAGGFTPTGAVPSAGGFSFGKAPAAATPAATAGPEWTCDTCMLKNPDSAKEQCTVCESPRPGAAAPASTGPPKPPAVPTTGGFAGFGAKPPASSSTSAPTTGGFTPTGSVPKAGGFSFGQKPTPPAPATSTGPEWTCDTCMLKNPDSAKEQCTVCETPRPGAATPPAAGPPKPPAVPTTGGFAGFGAKPAASSTSAPAAGGFSPAGAVPKAGGFSFGQQKPAAPAPTASSGPEWTCDTCMLKNPDSAKEQCTVCEAPRPGATPAAAATGPPKPPSVPAVGGFGAFGAKAPATAPAAGGPAPPAGGFSFGGATKPAATSLFGTTPAPAPGSLFGNKPLTTAAPTTAPAPGSLFGNNTPPPFATPAPAPGGLFGSTPAPPTSAPAPGSLFGAKTPSTPAAPSPFGGLGLGKPPAAAPAIATPAVSTPKTISLAQGPPPLSAGPSTTAAPPPPPTEPVQTFTVPKRPPPPAAPAAPAAHPKTMAATLERIISDVQTDLTTLKTTLKSNAGYHSALESPGFPKASSSTISQQTTLPFSALEDVLAITDELSQEIASVRYEVRQSDITLAELQSRMLKTDMKVGQAEKFVKARKDPSFARAMQIKELSPQQAAAQLRLRKVVQMTEARLDELDAGIAGLKRRSEHNRDSRRLSQQPALERIQRTLRNVDVAVRDRDQVIDDLSRRYSDLGLGRSVRESTPGPGTPSRQRSSFSASRSPASAAVSPAPRSGGLFGTPQATTSKAANPKPSVEPTTDVRKAAAAALDQSRRLRITRKTAVVTKLETGKDERPRLVPSSLVAHASVAKGPLHVDSMPVPGSFKQSPKQQNLGASISRTPKYARSSPPPATIAAVASPIAATPGASSKAPASGAAHSPAPAPSTPAAPTNNVATSSPLPVAGSFSGIKLVLDPGTLSSSSAPSARRNSPSTRAHGAAARLGHTPLPPAPTASQGTLFGSVVTPPTTEASNSNGGSAPSKPTGFFR